MAPEKNQFLFIHVLQSIYMIRTIPRNFWTVVDHAVNQRFFFPDSSGDLKVISIGLKVKVSNVFLIFVINSLFLVILFLDFFKISSDLLNAQGIVSHSENNLRHRCFWDCCLALPSPWNPSYPKNKVPCPKKLPISSKIDVLVEISDFKIRVNLPTVTLLSISGLKSTWNMAKVHQKPKNDQFLQFLDFLVDLSFLRIPTVI